MNPIDLKYVGMLSVRLDRYKVKRPNPYEANMRCPICGDSKVSKTKARGNIYERDNSAVYHCFNCGLHVGLEKFLKIYDISLYNNYVIDRKLEWKSNLPKTKTKTIDDIIPKRPVFDKKGKPLSKLKRVPTLSSDHPVKKYVESRRIPSDQHYRLYYAPKFNQWVNSIIPDKLNEKRDEPRLVLPFIDSSGELYGFAGRSFDKKTTLRYITIMLDDRPKIFGLDKVDFNKQYVVVEGGLDSLFLPNSVAMAGASIRHDGLENVDENAVFAFDNEPRNHEIIGQMRHVIDAGKSIVIWPQNLHEKDINDMVLAGHKPMHIINKNIYSGLDAKLALAIWRRS